MADIILADAATEEYDTDAVRALASAREFRRLLKNYSSRLDIFWARPGAESLQGGYWYIVRDNADFGADPSYWIIQNDDGSYSDPEYRHFERLQGMDSHAHPSLYKDYRRKQEELRRQGKRTQEEKHREFREKLLERLDHLYRAQVVIPTHVKDKLDREGEILPSRIDNAVSASGSPINNEVAALEPPKPKTKLDRKLGQVRKQIAKQNKRRKISGRLA